MPRFDVVIVGAGPAGSTAALCLARAGARVALVDRRGFPRDKACGDLVGPRGLRALDEMGITVSAERPVGDMVVVGPSGRSVLLPAFAGIDYPGHGFAMRRDEFDLLLFEAAASAGAITVRARVTGLAGEAGAVTGVRLATGSELHADVVIGADGAISQVAETAGLVDADRALWGFALRSYLDTPIDLPHILLWEPSRWRLFPGYGWIFPTPDGQTNVGLGLAVGADRTDARAAGDQFAEFLDHLTYLGLISAAHNVSNRLGGWLKIGQVGTVPARGNVLLAGDAAGLVNPLQGEGIAQAIISGRAAAAAVLDAEPDGAAECYLAALRETTAHHRINAPVQAAIVRHPTAVSAAGRVLTAPLVRAGVAGAWSLYWNDLVRGAAPSRHRTVARAVTKVATASSRRSAMDAWFTQAT